MRFRTVREKIIRRRQLLHIIERLKSSQKKIVFTNGCFDIIHWGHVYYLQEAAKLGDVLIVGLNSDSSIRRLKGDNRPLNTFYDRARVLASFEMVDFVIGFSEDTPYNLINKIRPDVLVKGGDWDPSDIVGAKEVISWGGMVETIPIRVGRSTTGIIQKILKIYGGEGGINERD